MQVLTPELVLSAYALGLFPMANDRDDPTIHWIDPIRRGIIPLEGLHVPRRLRRTLRRTSLTVSVDRAFAEVIRACAEPTPARPRTWLNDDMIAVYDELHRRGHGHSVEVWQEERLVGGVYGLAIGGAFFGESMFSRVRDASKIALIELVLRLREAGFLLLDTQFVTDHLRRFGAIEITRAEYRARLQRAIERDVVFPSNPQSRALGPTGMASVISRPSGDDDASAASDPGASPSSGR